MSRSKHGMHAKQGGVAMQGDITQVRSFVIETADEYTYHDRIDKSVAEHQGIRFLGRDGSRVVYRLSGDAQPWRAQVDSSRKALQISAHLLDMGCVAGPTLLLCNFQFAGWPKWSRATDMFLTV